MDALVCAVRASSIDLNFPVSQAFCAKVAALAAAMLALEAVLAARTADLTSSAAETAELASAACQETSEGYTKNGHE